jgi:hypothetical protein
MKNLIRVAGAIALFFLVWNIVVDYGDSVISGTYHLAQNSETSTLVLKPDHSFQQELTKLGKVERATGTWRHIGEGGVAISKEFLTVPGQEPGPDGTAYGELHKDFGLLISIRLRQYHVLWYGRIDPPSGDKVSGTYTGDEEGVPATLVLKPDHTFEQTVGPLGATKRAKGSWSLGQNGDIVFSKDFLKTSGEALGEFETASAQDPKGPNLQIEIAMTSKSGAPTFRKRQIHW